MFFRIFVALVINKYLEYGSIMVKLKKGLLLSLISALFVSINAYSDNNSISIVEHISSSNNIIINQPAKLGERLKHNNNDEKQEQPTALGSMAGYRILIFSDNNSRTAKSEARAKARNISAVFPHYRTYVTYNSPYWRLKVGDFRTNQEAAKAMDEIKKEFPTYSREIRIVRDRINITE